MFSKCTLALTFFAASATVFLVIAATENVGPPLPAAVIMLFIIGPYAALAALAWLTRFHRVMSVVVFFVTLALSSFGLYLFSVDCYQFFTDPEYRQHQRLTVFIVPLVQWFFATGLGLVLIPLLAYQGSRIKQSPAA